MKLLTSTLRLLVLTSALGSFARAQTTIIEQWVPAGDRDCTPNVWFQAINSGVTAPAGHSGMMSIASGVFGSPVPLLYSGWVTFTPQGAFLTLVGGLVTSYDILDPAGAPITDVRGSMTLAAGFEIDVNAANGDVVNVLLQAGFLMWTPTHVYLVLLGGSIAVYDVTAAGLPIAGIRGMTRLAADIVDTDPSPNLVAVLCSGTVAYSDTKTWLITTSGLVGATEVTFGGASIPGVRGAYAMGGVANPATLSTGSFLWTASKVLLMLTGGGVSVSEVLDPVGASIPKAWGITRQGPQYLGGGAFSGAASIITQTKEVFVLVGGGVATYDVVRPTGGAITSNVALPPGPTLLHQSGGLQEAFASWAPPGVPSTRGTAIGSMH